ncbi:hypothetical protein CDL15_Pgr021231 [Punica granatum]|uniref:Uncharacterized protein n=1 Tax=Punica granatum TaxID=22663 RepID=A0A218WR94_PUNGR|nr:hypothetical protein CDL15_Pgr021231 [Punica granatum]PKI68321.1 hypothetical protein CRG98_011229 [Punica granatum]
MDLEKNLQHEGNGAATQQKRNTREENREGKEQEARLSSGTRLTTAARGSPRRAGQQARELSRGEQRSSAAQGPGEDPNATTMTPGTRGGTGQVLFSSGKLG